MTFEEWWDHDEDIGTGGDKEAAQQAWDHQQATIEDLRYEIRELEDEVLHLNRCSFDGQL